MSTNLSPSADIYTDSVWHGSNNKDNVNDENSGTLWFSDNTQPCFVFTEWSTATHKNVLLGGTATAERGTNASNALDEDDTTYWDGGVSTLASWWEGTFESGNSYEVNAIYIDAHATGILDEFTIKYWDGDSWENVTALTQEKWSNPYTGSSNSADIFFHFEPVTTNKIRVYLDNTGTVKKLAQVRVWNNEGFDAKLLDSFRLLGLGARTANNFRVEYWDEGSDDWALVSPTGGWTNPVVGNTTDDLTLTFTQVSTPKLRIYATAIELSTMLVYEFEALGQDIESLVDGDTVTLTDSIVANIPQENISQGDTVNLSDAITTNVSREKVEDGDTITLSDDITFTFTHTLEEEELITLSDAILTNLSREQANIGDTVTLTDTSLVTVTEREYINNRINTAMEVLEDINQDVRIRGEEEWDLLNFINLAQGVLSDIDNDVRTKKEVLSEISNNIRFLNPLPDIPDLEDSVATYNDLPVTGNTQGDIRETEDTGDYYFWNNAAASGSLSDWSAIVNPIQIPRQPLGFESFEVKINGGSDISSTITNLTWRRSFNNEPSTASFTIGSDQDNISSYSAGDEVDIYFNGWHAYHGFATYSVSDNLIHVRCEDWVSKIARKAYDAEWGRHVSDNPDESSANTIYDALKNVLDSLVSDGVIDSYYDPPFGEIIPEPQKVESERAHNLITRLVQEAGNYDWFITPGGKWAWRKRGDGHVVTLPMQENGRNIDVYDVIDNNFILNEDSNIINKAWVTLSKKSIVTKDPTHPDTILIKRQVKGYLSPAWTVGDEPDANGHWWRWIPSTMDQDLAQKYREVFTYYNIVIPAFPAYFGKIRLDSDFSQPATILRRGYTRKASGGTLIYSEGDDYVNCGFTVDLNEGTVRFSEPQGYEKLSYSQEAGSNQIVPSTSWKSRRLIIYLRVLQEKELDDNGNIIWFPFPKLPTTIPPSNTTEATEFWVEMDTDVGYDSVINKNFPGFTYDEKKKIGDVEYAADLTAHELSKTAHSLTSGSVQLTFDAHQIYGIDLDRMINLEHFSFKGTRDSRVNGFPLNITSIDYDASSYLVTLNLESQYSYTRDESYRGFEASIQPA